MTVRNSALPRPAFTFLLAVLAIAIFFAAYPLYVIRPFRHQGAQELQAALFVLHWQHIVELVCAAAALIAVAVLRPHIRTITVTALVLVFAGLSFVNVFEVMFHPAGAPAFQSVRDTRLDGDEKVLAVNARAYPIRSISYHHIVNDTVVNDEGGSVPIAVTY